MKEYKTVRKVGRSEPTPSKDLDAIVDYDDGEGSLDDLHSAAKDEAKNAPAEEAERSLSLVNSAILGEANCHASREMESIHLTLRR